MQLTTTMVRNCEFRLGTCKDSLVPEQLSSSP